MEDFPMQKITIYHKENNKYIKYVKEASYRNTSILNRNTTGTSNTDSALIRIFDIEGLGTTWNINKEDIIVNKEVADEIEGTTPLTQLTQKYGKENVHKITSIDKFVFNEDLDHIKIGAI